ncbi:MAG TPA: flagellar hook-associated protein FlgL [Cellvibrio sp.]|nr:flagellar hook-associated protein FlgL [Cellvibrio sp.]
MRVSTSQIYTIASLGMGQAQSAVTKTQEQIATGKKVLSPADDPVAATAILRLNQELARTEQYGKNINMAESSLNLEESTIQTVVDLVQRMREQAVKAGNTAVFTAADYKAIAAEVDTRIAELVNLQNTRNASGQYIFAGYQGDTKPFVGDIGGNYSYKGDEGQLRLQASTSVTVAVSDSGKKLFVDIPSGHQTFNTTASASNKSTPPAVISVGEVIDQDEFNRLYPEDLQITFSKNGSAVNFTVTERSTGKILLPTQLFVAGEDIEVAGARFKIMGNPHPGEPAIPATIPFTSAPAVALAAGDQFGIRVGGKTEYFTMAGPVNNATDLANELNLGSAVPPALPTGNAAKLAGLGISVTAAGIVSASGLNVEVVTGTNGTSPSAAAIMGSDGTRSVNLPFTFAPTDFSANPTTFQLEANGKTESFTFNQNITGVSPNTLREIFNDPTNLPKLIRLGLTVTDQGIIANNNSRVTIKGGNIDLNNVTGLSTRGVGTSSTRGALIENGDSFFVESTDKQGLLTTLTRFSEAMKTVSDTPESKAELAKIIEKTLTNLQNVITKLTSVQGEVGSRLNTLESSKDLNLDITLSTKTSLSDLQSVDIGEASIQLSMQSLILSASQQSFAKVSQLTLFTYL